jgi:thioesterase domain-containing protein
MGLEGVREAVVVGHVEADGDSRLIAYLAGSRQAPPTHDELRSLLRDRLPEYMLPSAFVFIDEIPLTPNGKVDRRALPAPGSARPNLKKSYHAPQNALEELLVGLWQEVLGLDRVGTDDDFFTLGGDSIKGAVLINRLQAILGEIVHVVAIFDAPTVARLSAYLADHYANAVARTLGNSAAPGEAGSDRAASQSGTLSETTVAEMRRLIKPLAPRRASGRAEPKNPQAIFVLAPPRSGTTLLRVMMAGHPQLFAPPELELMSFNTLAERRAAFTGKNSFWREGTIRAIMQVKDCDADRAKAIMEECEDRQMTTQQFYRLLQTWIGARRLVDKTPSYVLDKAILERMEADFESPLYVHLLRHPAGMIHSFDEYKLEQLFFQYEHRFPRRQLAELIYLVSHQNIMEFLRQISQARQHTIKFEDLLSEPQTAMKRLCDFLGLDLHPGMLKPYDDRSRKMADGLQAESRMLGDVKFNTYRDIDARVGDRWKGAIAEEGLSPLTQDMAAALGYPLNRTARPDVSTPDVWRDRTPLQLIQRGDHEPPLFCVHPVGGGAAHYAHLASALGAERSFYGLQGLDPDESFIDLEERAARLVKAVREVQPRGPYLLGGWSFGGLVAFEMAQQLRDQGEAIALLALLDPMLPGGYEGRVLPVNSEAENLAHLIQQIGELVGWHYGGLREAIDNKEHPQQVYRSLRERQILPPELGFADMVTWLRALKDKLHTAFRYKPRRYEGKITLFRPEERYQQDCRAQGSFLGLDLTGAWGRLSSEPIDVHLVPGSHHTMVVQPDVDALAARLRACIREAVNSNLGKAII